MIRKSGNLIFRYLASDQSNPQGSFGAQIINSHRMVSGGQYPEECPNQKLQKSWKIIFGELDFDFEHKCAIYLSTISVSRGKVGHTSGQQRQSRLRSRPTTVRSLDTNRRACLTD